MDTLASHSAPPVLYREAWAEIPPERPLSQRHVAHRQLRLSVHGPGAPGLKKSHHDDVPGDPYYVWSGKCAGPWALALRHGALFVDAHDACVVLRTRQSGPHRLHVVAKTRDGAWLVSDEGADATADWCDHVLELGALAWRELDVDALVAGPEATLPACLDAVGVADFRAGGDVAACSRLAALEVRATAVRREVRT